MKRRQALQVLSIWEKAAIRRDWATDNLSAQIHALTGQNAPLMVNKAGRIMFVVLGAAMAQGIEQDHPDIRILRGAVNALSEQVDEVEIAEHRRASIVSGLDAAARLNIDLSPEAIFRAACDMNLKIRFGGVHLSDFQKLVNQGATAC